MAKNNKLTIAEQKRLSELRALNNSSLNDSVLSKSELDELNELIEKELIDMAMNL